jgi:hypothetical protein
MSRPTHAQQQQTIDDAMAALPSARWRWLFTPDPRWLASVNTTTLREVNAVRMFVGVTALFAVSYVAVIGFALTRCGVVLHLFGHRIFQMLPPPGKLSVEAWRMCEDSTATGRMLDFASGLFGSYSLLLAAMATVAVGSNILKRVTDTEHKVKVEEAKKAPIILPATGEHQAQAAPIQQTTVNVGEEALKAKSEPDKPAEEPEWAQGDPRGGIL